MTKLEEVARAILKARQEHGLSGAALWEHEPPNIQRIYLDTARAAIEAMRMPNEAMLEAMRRATSYDESEWLAAIDAILSESDRDGRG